jgi:hypothetical protein
MSEFIDRRFRENKPKTLVSVIENERFGLVFAKTRSVISGTRGKPAVLHASPPTDFKISFDAYFRPVVCNCTTGETWNQDRLFYQSLAINRRFPSKTRRISSMTRRFASTYRQFSSITRRFSLLNRRFSSIFCIDDFSL